MPQLRLLLPLALFAIACVLTGCPPTDDDDSSDEPVQVGVAPVVGNVELCEVPVPSADCQGMWWEVRFDINVTDEDCDLDNPYWRIRITDGDPIGNRYEGSLGCGGGLRIDICDDGWVRGTELSYEVDFSDAEDNVSEPWQGTWQVPQDGDDDCGPG